MIPNEFNNSINNYYKESSCGQTNTTKYTNIVLHNSI